MWSFCQDAGPVGTRGHAPESAPPMHLRWPDMHVEADLTSAMCGNAVRRSRLLGRKMDLCRTTDRTRANKRTVKGAIALKHDDALAGGGRR